MTKRRPNASETAETDDGSVHIAAADASALEVPEHGLKQPHEAYVAFAFAAADLLMEADHTGRIIFAVGAAMSLVGRPARLLATMRLEQIVRPEDRFRLTKALQRMAGGSRVRHILLQVLLPNGSSTPVALSGYPHPDHRGRLLLVLTHSGGLASPALRRDDCGMLSRQGFEVVAESIIKEGGASGDDSYRLTLLDMPELAELRNQVGVEATARFVSRFTDYLRQCSVGGETAVDLGDSKYGVIHGPDVSAQNIAETIHDLARSVVGCDLAASAASLSLDAGNISAHEATSALVYTLNRFTAEGGGTIQELSAAAQPHLTATVAKMRAVKTVIGNGDFHLTYQPIVDLWNNAVHHFECLVRFGTSGESPFTTVTFAEDTGLVGDLDYAILERAIGFMRDGPGSEDSLRFAVNLSGRSLSNPKTAARLLQMIHNARDLRGRLLFEVTESAAIVDLVAANAVIQEIRARGHPVGIDDFGSGAAAFHYLRALKVDHVKIDGSYVREAAGNGDSLPFLRAITQLCRELKIATIAEHIEDEATANLLRVYNVRYGQGYYFGRPMIPAADRSGKRGPWLTPGNHWRNGMLYFGPKSAPSPSGTPDDSGTDIVREWS